MARYGRRQFFQTYSWEILIFIFYVLSVVVASLLSPLYLDAFQILYSLQQSMGIAGILAIGFMMIILVGEIDLSLPAILAVGTVSFARLSVMGVPFGLAVLIVFGFSILFGLLNGFLIVTFSLPSMAVTLGMMGVYRAIALWIGGFEGFGADAFQPSYIWIGDKSIAGVIPVSFLLLVFLFILSYLLVHKSVYGRLLYATGNNRKATHLSGHNIKLTIASTYGIGGLMSAVGAMVYIGQYQSARADNVASILLFVVACIALGGFSLSGGKGRVIGLILSILILGTIQNGMGLANIIGPIQTLVIGLILVASIMVPWGIRAIDGVRSRVKNFAEEKSANS
ncbi:MAG TPA: ABC transporter permease [bacterium]|nr:ABC transporter permease [bacterium]